MENQTEATERKTILIVDDSVIARRMVAFALQGLECDLLEAEDGSEAIACLLDRKVDLLITDLKMPVIDGFELSRRARSIGGLADLPIIMLSQVDGTVQKETARRIGVSLFISKPFTPEQISGLVREILW